jgi:peptidoglycan/LPS O-acetylase OafA/YrhL
VPIIATQASPPVLIKAPVSAAKSRSFHIASLDGIRGLAFLLVFFSHAGLRNIIPGGFGVTVFFFLSGYLIATLLRLEFKESGRIDLRAFYIRRAFRILPLFYLVLIAALLLRYAGQLSGSLDAPAIVSQFFQWSNYYLIVHGSTSVVGGTIVLWSLAVEEHFYLVFPLLYRWFRGHLNKAKQLWLLCGGCVACLLWRCALIFFFHRPYVRTELATDSRFDCLLLGVILAVAANPALDEPRWFSRKWLRALVPLAIACLVFTFVYRSDGFRATFRYTLQPLALLPLFAYAIRARGSASFRFLNSRIMTQLGVVSYGLYLVHAILLDWFSIHLHAGGAVVALTTFAAAFLVAKFLQITVERPFQSLRSRYIRVRPLRAMTDPPQSDIKLLTF